MDVFLDPRLPDYFREHSFSELKKGGQGVDTAFADFLNQRLCVVHGLTLADLDLDFLGSIQFPQTWEFKKLQVAHLTDFLGNFKSSSMVLNEGFAGDKGAYAHFIEQVKVLKRISDELLAAILPGKPEAVNLLTRFSETRMENLHYDLDASSDDHEAFRLYINLDRAPRLWATSYQMTELIRQGGQRLVHGIDASMPGETILRHVVTRAYGGWNQRATERVSPHHMVYIDPGDIFFVDGRGVSHQVLSGQRVFTLYAKIPHALCKGVGPTFNEKIRGALAEAQTIPIGKETALVNYFEPGQITPAKDIRAQWQTVFGETKTGRIRRFDDVGMK